MADCGVKDDMYQSALHSPPSQLCPQASKSSRVNPHLQPSGKAPSTSGVLCLLIAAEEPLPGVCRVSASRVLWKCDRAACWNAEPVVRLIRLHKKQQEMKYS